MYIYIYKYINNIYIYTCSRHIDTYIDCALSNQVEDIREELILVAEETIGIGNQSGREGVDCDTFDRETEKS